MPTISESAQNALKRLPAQIAGGSVDTVNFVLGLLSGKGMSGLTKDPIGGSERLNTAQIMVSGKLKQDLYLLMTHCQ